jgi:hypothetical protein
MAFQIAEAVRRRKSVLQSRLNPEGEPGRGAAFLILDRQAIEKGQESLFSIAC